MKESVIVIKDSLSLRELSLFLKSKSSFDTSLACGLSEDFLVNDWSMVYSAVSLASFVSSCSDIQFTAV